MYKKSVQEIKRSQKESLLLRELSNLFLRIIIEDKELEGLSITSIKLSPDSSRCTVFFYSAGGSDEFDRLRPRLVLYKPSLRKSLSRSLALRHTPDLRFKYDKQIEKQHEIEYLLNKIKTEEQS